MGIFKHNAGARRVLLIFTFIALLFLLPQSASAWTSIIGGATKGTAAEIASFSEWYYEPEQDDDTAADWTERWYKVTLTESGRIGISTENKNDPVTYTVFDDQNGIIDTVSLDAAAEDANFKHYINYNVAGGTYYICFSRPNNSAVVNYGLKIGFAESGESFSPSKDKASDLVSEAKKQSAIKLGKRYTGWLAINDATDAYKVTLGSSGRLSINLINELKSMDFELYDHYGSKVYYETLSTTKGTTRNIDLVKGNYYFKFSRNSINDTGKYKVKTTFESADETREETVKSTNNTIAKAKARSALSFGSAYRGQFAANDDIDIYRITVTRAGNLLLGMNSAIGTMQVRLLNSSEKRIPGRITFYEGKSALTYSVGKGTYYLSFKRPSHSNTGVYLFKVFQQPLPSEVVAKKRLKRAARIRWKKVSGVTGYQIMIAKNSKFTKGKRIITISENNNRTIIRSLKKGKIYHVKIRSYCKAFGKMVYSSWGKTRQIRAKKEIKVKKTKKKSKKKS